jgi:hypothetical protein
MKLKKNINKKKKQRKEGKKATILVNSIMWGGVH